MERNTLFGAGELSVLQLFLLFETRRRVKDEEGEFRFFILHPRLKAISTPYCCPLLSAKGDWCGFLPLAGVRTVRTQESCFLFAPLCPSLVMTEDPFLFKLCVPLKWENWESDSVTPN